MRFWWYTQNNLEYLEYDPSGNSISSIHVKTDIFNLLFLYDLFLLFYV